MPNAPRTTEVMTSIRSRILGRMLLPGERLPSIRSLAATLGVSPSTVVEAYDRLVAEGAVWSRPGSGFYVAGAAAPKTPVTEPERDRDIDPFWVSRQSLDADPAVLKPGCGWLPPDWMPQAAIRKALRSLARDEDALLTDYGSSRGPLDLRVLLARQAADTGVDLHADQLLLTSSGSQSIDLICRLLLRPGDTVLIDDPCYFNFQALLRIHGLRTVSVPFTHDGPDLEAFAAELAAHDPRLYITNSALHNPTGATISARTAHRVLTLAAAHELIIVEDETFAVLEPDPSPRYAALDGLDRVIRIGSFSKTLSASIRCGYIAARAELIEALTDLQVATNFGGPGPMATAIVRATLADGSYRKHLEATRRRLSRARREVVAKLGVLGIEPWLMPRGGFYLWCRLPDGRNAAEVARQALSQGVVLAPGNVFSHRQAAPDMVRFNVSQMADPRIYEVLGRGQ